MRWFCCSVTEIVTVQVAERLTALKAACTALEPGSKGRNAEARLQKALAKLQKVENPLSSQPQPPAPVSAPAAAAATIHVPEAGQSTGAAPLQTPLPPVSHPSVAQILIVAMHKCPRRALVLLGHQTRILLGLRRRCPAAWLHRCTQDCTPG